MGTSYNIYPLVSVVIPTYNRAYLVGRAIKSVLAQTLGDFEVIVVDDGSTDNTVEVVQAFQDPQIRLLQLAGNCGASRALNVGIQAAGGEWVAFLDSDDEWLPQKLEMQVARARQAGGDNRVAVVYCQCYIYDESTTRKVLQPSVTHEGDPSSHLLMDWGLPTRSIVMAKRSCLLDVGGFDEKLSTFYGVDLWLRLAEASHHFVAVNQPLVRRFQVASATGTL